MGDQVDVVAVDGALETFALERFGWEAPDRLELCGTFAGLRDVPREPPVLIVSGAERSHRLPAVAEGAAGPPEDGRPWRAGVAWQEAPEGFDRAELELGPDVVVQLPGPGTESEPRGLVLRVRRTPSVAEPSAPPEPGGAASGAARLRLALEAIEDELVRSQDDLDA